MNKIHTVCHILLSSKILILILVLGLYLESMGGYVKILGTISIHNRWTKNMPKYGICACLRGVGRFLYHFNEALIFRNIHTIEINYEEETLFETDRKIG